MCGAVQTGMPELRPDHELAAHEALPRRLDYIARDSILQLLTEAELAQVCTAEQGMVPAPGDEYLDLEHLEQGVLTAPVLVAAAPSMLPRSAVSAPTWQSI